MCTVVIKYGVPGLVAEILTEVGQGVCAHEPLGQRASADHSSGNWPRSSLTIGWAGPRH